MEGCKAAILVGAHEFFLLYKGEAVLKSVQDTEYKEGIKCMFFTCFNKHSKCCCTVRQIYPHVMLMLND